MGAEMKVYLCEKPSQGEDVAKFLGMTPANKKHGYFQNGDVAVTWARGIYLSYSHLSIIPLS